MLNAWGNYLDHWSPYFKTIFTIMSHDCRDNRIFAQHACVMELQFEGIVEWIERGILFNTATDATSSHLTQYAQKNC